MIRALLSHVTIEVDHTDELMQLFLSLWEFEGLNNLDCLWCGHNTVTSDRVTQLLNFMVTKALFFGVDLEPSLLEAGKHIFSTGIFSVYDLFVTRKRSSM